MVASGGVYQWSEGEKIGTQGAEFEHESNQFQSFNRNNFLFSHCI